MLSPLPKELAWTPEGGLPALESHDGKWRQGRVGQEQAVAPNSWMSCQGYCPNTENQILVPKKAMASVGPKE